MAGFIARIKGFIKGDVKRTPMHADAMNEIVGFVNALLAAKGINGIQVIPAASGFVYQLDQATQKKLGMIPTVNPDGTVTPPTGPLRFRGLWSATVTDYVANDIVIWDSAAAIATGYNAGTYIALSDVPTGSEPVEKFAGTQTYWFTVARGSWDRLKMADSAGAFGSVDIQLTESGTLGTSGKDLAIREVDICVSGVAKKMRVLGSEPYV